ncbi:reactive oxygen species modulator 1-like [Acomys russatus]|uniref:reactive oxygen species modulator 1-like n=1 Tax=Acomys russatus TaxID=60746 RepID=UPI0021E23B93|nr:reactive oxygen species modulator 1-like [Acomys russatus]
MEQKYFMKHVYLLSDHDGKREAGGPYGQSQPSCFNRVKMGFVTGCAVGMAAGALFSTFSCLRIGMQGQELMGGIGKTMMQSGGTFGTFMATGMGIRC